MYLVVGATGPIGLGGEICRLLRAAGKPTRALVRRTSNSNRVANLRALGVDIVEGDLKDPRTLEAACQDVRAVISTASMLVSQQTRSGTRNAMPSGIFKRAVWPTRFCVPPFIWRCGRSRWRLRLSKRPRRKLWRRAEQDQLGVFL